MPGYFRAAENQYLGPTSTLVASLRDKWRRDSIFFWSVCDGLDGVRDGTAFVQSLQLTEVMQKYVLSLKWGINLIKILWQSFYGKALYYSIKKNGKFTFLMCCYSINYSMIILVKHH